MAMTYIEGLIGQLPEHVASIATRYVNESDLASNAEAKEKAFTNFVDAIMRLPPHQVLGVNSNASSDEIKKAYRRLAVKFHPDRRKPELESTRDAELLNEIIKKINTSNKILMNPPASTQEARRNAATKNERKDAWRAREEDPKEREARRQQAERAAAEEAARRQAQAAKDAKKQKENISDENLEAILNANNATPTSRQQAISALLMLKERTYSDLKNVIQFIEQPESAKLLGAPHDSYNQFLGNLIKEWGNKFDGYLKQLRSPKEKESVITFTAAMLNSEKLKSHLTSLLSEININQMQNQKVQMHERNGVSSPTKIIEEAIKQPILSARMIVLHNIKNLDHESVNKIFEEVIKHQASFDNVAKHLGRLSPRSNEYKEFLKQIKNEWLAKIDKLPINEKKQVLATAKDSTIAKYNRDLLSNLLPNQTDTQVELNEMRKKLK